MARQKLSTSEIPIARRAEAIGRGPGPWKEAPDPKNGVGGMAKHFKLINGNLPEVGQTLPEGHTKQAASRQI